MDSTQDQERHPVYVELTAPSVETQSCHGLVSSALGQGKAPACISLTTSQHGKTQQKFLRMGKK